MRFATQHFIQNLIIFSLNVMQIQTNVLRQDAAARVTWPDFTPITAGKNKKEFKAKFFVCKSFNLFYFPPFFLLLLLFRTSVQPIGVPQEG